jgi:hypothetical protein
MTNFFSLAALAKTASFHSPQKPSLLSLGAAWFALHLELRTRFDLLLDPAERVVHKAGFARLVAPPYPAVALVVARSDSPKARRKI